MAADVVPPCCVRSAPAPCCSRRPPASPGPTPPQAIWWRWTGCAWTGRGLPGPGDRRPQAAPRDAAPGPAGGVNGPAAALRGPAEVPVGAARGGRPAAARPGGLRGRRDPARAGAAVPPLAGLPREGLAGRQALGVRGSGGSVVRVDRRFDVAEVALPGDGPRPQRRQVAEGRGGVAGMHAPRPGGTGRCRGCPRHRPHWPALAPDNVSGPPHDLAFTRRGADSPGAVSEYSDERGGGRRD
jgi:hypothetical protein